MSQKHVVNFMCRKNFDHLSANLSRVLCASSKCLQPHALLGNWDTSEESPNLAPNTGLGLWNIRPCGRRKHHATSCSPTTEWSNGRNPTSSQILFAHFLRIEKVSHCNNSCLLYPFVCIQSCPRGIRMMRQIHGGGSKVLDMDSFSGSKEHVALTNCLGGQPFLTAPLCANYDQFIQ